MRALIAVLPVLLAFAQLAHGQTLDRIRERGALRIGIETDGPPFSYRNEAGVASGYSVALCQAIAQDVGAAIGQDPLPVEPIDIPPEEEFESLVRGDVDLVCGATAMSLGAREQVDFSLPTFMDGLGVLYRANGPDSVQDLAGGRMGVLDGTTTEARLRQLLERSNITAEIVAFPDNDAGVDALQAQEIGAYFADNAVLAFLMIERGTPEGLIVSDRIFAFETFALALPRGDDDFRLLVDRSLSRLYRSGEIQAVFKDAFGQQARPSEAVVTLYAIHALPE